MSSEQNVMRYWLKQSIKRKAAQIAERIVENDSIYRYSDESDADFIIRIKAKYTKGTRESY